MLDTLSSIRFSCTIRKISCSAGMEISEAEDYLEFLRAKKSKIELQVMDTEEQIGVL